MNFTVYFIWTGRYQPSRSVQREI